MFVRNKVLSLVLPFFVRQAIGQSEIQLDVSSQDSVKSAAKSLAGGLISAYNLHLNASHVPGLFGVLTYWWEAGVIWNAMIGYSYLTGDSQYNDIISQALQWQIGDYDAFMPANQTKTLGNEDQSCWGLAAMTAAEVGFPKPADAEWVDFAANVWNTQALRLDLENNGTCGGGLRWQIFSFNNGYDYKNTMTNGNFFLLSARLAKYTGNSTYIQYADKVFKWSQDVGLVSKDFKVYDGTDSSQGCRDVNSIMWTAPHGIYTEGAALMFNMTGAQNWRVAVTGFVNSSSIFQSSNNSAIVEVACENNGKCNIDQRAFKGIFARTFARAALAAPFAADSINKMLSASAKGAASACTAGNDPECKLSWSNADSKWESESASNGNLGEVFGALEVVQGLLYPSAKGLKTVSGSGAGNSTQNGGASGTPSGGVPQQTGAAGSVLVSMTAIFAVAFSAALNF